MTDDETIIKEALKEWKVYKIDQLNGEGVREPEEFKERTTPSEATLVALQEAIKLARADEREKIKGIIDDVSCDEDSRCFDDESETYISLKALLKALEAQGK